MKPDLFVLFMIAVICVFLALSTYILVSIAIQITPP